MNEPKFTQGTLRVIHRPNPLADELPYMVMATLTPVGNARLAEVIQAGDAFLFAAAPDLYHALNAWQQFYASDEGVSHLNYRHRLDELHTQACAALAKARGETA